MRLLTILTSVLLFSACAKGGSDSTPQANDNSQISPAQPFQPPPQPVDYSKITCGSTHECIEACDVLNPYMDPSTLSVVGVSGMSSTNTQYMSANTACLSKMVTDVILASDIGTQSCSTGVACQNFCEQLFPVQSDQAIRASQAAKGLLNSGSTELLIYQNHLLMMQQAACKAAPMSYVMR